MGAELPGRAGNSLAKLGIETCSHNHKQMNLNDFLEDLTLRNAWIKERHLSAYIRRSTRCLEAKTLVLCLDLAVVKVTKRFMGKGIFTAFLNRFEAEAQKLGRIVVVECVLNDQLRQHLLTKRHYRALPEYRDSQTLYLPKHKKARAGLCPARASSTDQSPLSLFPKKLTCR